MPKRKYLSDRAERQDHPDKINTGRGSPPGKYRSEKNYAVSVDNDDGIYAKGLDAFIRNYRLMQSA